MKLCIVTDIFSRPAPHECIVAKLPNVSDVARFALNDLCGRPDLTGEQLHRHLFTHGGIAEAARTLKSMLGSGYFGLGYSAGGTVLWRAAMQGMCLKGLYCISSTRLRTEAAISTPNHVFFGALDQKMPSPEWLSTMPEQHTIFHGARHTFYLEVDSDAVKKASIQIANDMRSSVSEIG